MAKLKKWYDKIQDKIGTKVKLNDIASEPRFMLSAALQID